MKAKPRLNARWHEQHPMPRKATVEQRLAWHLEHQKQCGCRPIPASLAKRGKARHSV